MTDLVPLNAVSREISLSAHNLSALIEFGRGAGYGGLPQALVYEVKNLFGSLFEFVVSLCLLLMYLVVAVLRVISLNMPFFLAVGRAVVEFHRTQLSVTDMVVEVVLVTIITLVLVYRDLMVDHWCVWEKKLEKHSRVVARAAPSVLFFGSCFAFSVMGRNFLAPLVASTVLPLFTLVGPVVLGIYFLLDLHTADVAAAGGDVNPRHFSTAQMNVQLTLWLILASYHGVATFLAAFPFASHVNVNLDWVRRFVLIVVVCIQVSPIQAARVYETAAPLAREISAQMPVPVLTSPVAKKVAPSAKKKPLTRTAPHGANASSAPGRAQPILDELGKFGKLLVAPVFYMVKASGILTTQQEEVLVGLAQDSVALALSVLSCCMPSFVAVFGLLAVAFAVPAFKMAELQGALSTLAIEEAKPAAQRSSVDHDVLSSRSSSSSSSRSPGWAAGLMGMLSPGLVRQHHQPDDDLAEQRAMLEAQVQRWLSYWVLWAAVWALRTYSVASGGRGPWVSVLLLTALYLQHSYFRGAEHAIGLLVNAFREVMARVYQSEGARKFLCWKDEFSRRVRDCYKAETGSGARCEGTNTVVHTPAPRHRGRSKGLSRDLDHDSGDTAGDHDEGGSEEYEANDERDYVHIASSKSTPVVESPQEGVPRRRSARKKR